MSSEIKRNIKNVVGTKTNRKLVAFFVDDYGSIRTKSTDAFNQFVESGIKFREGVFSFSKYDSLADQLDLS